MALTSRQRRALPPGAFIDPKRRRFPIPTAAQARSAGIGETQRINMLRNALSRAAQQPRRSKRGAPTIGVGTVRAKVRARAGGKIASVKPARRAPARRRRAPARRRRTRR